MNQQDLRVVKTKKNIEHCFLKLLEDKSFFAITVQNLLDTALINRSTFYKHYTDKYDLATQLTNKCFHEFETLLQTRFSISSPEKLLTAIENIYQNLYENRNTILALWHIQTESIHLYEDMASYLKEAFCKVYLPKFQGTAEQLDFISSAYSSLIMSSIKWCLNHHYENVKDLLTIFTPHLLKAFDELS